MSDSLTPEALATLVAHGGSLAAFAWRIAPFLGRPLEKLLTSKANASDVRDMAAADRDATRLREESAVQEATTRARVSILNRFPELIISTFPLHQQHVLRSLLQRETRHLQNRETIVREAALELGAKQIEPDAVDDDWLDAFFDASQRVSDAAAQQAFARLLAAKMQTPRRFSKRTLRTIADMDSYDVKMLRRQLSRLVFYAEPGTLAVGALWDSEEAREPDDDLDHLESIGLISWGGRRVGPKTEWSLTNTTRRWNMGSLKAEGETTYEPPDSFVIGRAKLTIIGEELCSMYDIQPSIAVHMSIERWVRQCDYVCLSSTQL